MESKPTEQQPIAAEIHITSIIEAMERTNERGGFHRDALRTRLDALEEEKKQLENQLAQCDTEIQDVRKNSEIMGVELEKTRASLAQHVLKLLAEESNEIQNRELMFKTCTEQRLAHYQDGPSKQTHLELLLTVDRAMREAYVDGISLPILCVRAYDDGGYNDTYTGFGTTNPSENGLSIDEQGRYGGRCSVKLANYSDAYTPEPQANVLTVGEHTDEEWRIANNSGEVQTYVASKDNWFGASGLTSHFVGDASIAAHLTECIENLDDNTQDHLFTLGKLLRSHPDWANKLRDQHPQLGKLWSDRAAAEITKEYRASVDILIQWVSMLDDDGKEVVVQKYETSFGKSPEWTRNCLDFAASQRSNT